MPPHDLINLFGVHAYDNAIIFGHAKDGNLHFVITQSFNTQGRPVDQYSYFIDDVVKLVVEKYDGALKAEHGTGRNMAPFVRNPMGYRGFRDNASVEAVSRSGEPAEPWGDSAFGNPTLVRTLSVKPPRGTGRLRLVRSAPGTPSRSAACGGTHVGRTGEIGPLRVVKIENKGRQNRRVVVALAE